MAYKLTDQELADTLDLLKYHGSVAKVSKVTGLSERAIRDRRQMATRRNLNGTFLGGPLPDGYTLGKVTSLVSEDGTRMEWQHKLPDADRLDEMVDILIETMNSAVTPLPEIPAPGDGTTVANFVTMYGVADAHLGQYSWGKESGENYDLEIARDQFIKATTELYALTPHSHTALIVFLGDYFHADNNRATTERSNNHLDVDGRHDKVLHLGGELAIWHIDMALQKHARVVVKVMRGNHDPHASKALTMALWFRYQGNPRVSIDRTPLDLWAFQWGSTMLAFTHGDNVRAEQMPGAMAAGFPEMWGATKWRFGYSGHFHKRKAGQPWADELNGAEWEILPAFTAKDAWNKSMGHYSKRGLQAITFDSNEGKKFTTYVTIKGA